MMWHLRLRFPAFDDEDERKLTRARLDVVEQIFRLAERHAVDAVLCAGDLFDSPDPDPDWWQGLLALLKNRPPRPTFLLPGNHDPLTPKSVYHPSHPFRQGLPAWAQVVDRPDFTAELSPEVTLVAAPCTSQAGDKDLAMSLPARAPGDARLRVGLVHGQTVDIPGCQTNFPIAADAAERRGLNYLALGDTHSFRKVPGAAVPTVYPSSPEPTRFHEADSGFVALVFLRRSGPALVEQVRVAHWTWREERCTNVAALRRLSEENLTSTVLRLVLQMAVSVPEYDEVETLLRALKGTTAAHGRAGVLHVDRRRLEIATLSDEGFPADLPSVLQHAISRLRASEDQELAKRALVHLYQLVRPK